MKTIVDKSLLLDADTMPVALLRLDKKRCIQAMNTGAETLFGISRRAGQGKRLSDMLYHDCVLFDLIDRAEETLGKVSAPTLTLDGPSMRPQAAMHTSVSIADEGGFAIAFSQNAVGEMSEIDTAGLAAFGRILGHEVKNPLAGLSGATQLLLRRAREDQKELLGLILSESERITRLVDKLSAFELFSSPRRLPCNVHQILEHVIRSEEVAFERSVAFERNFDPSLPDVLADGDHLHEAFQNIIRNGAEAVRDNGGGRVAISTRFSLDRRSSSGACEDVLRSIKITIIDDGPGVSSKHEKKIFEMFQTTKQSGSGLGLTIASQIISAHDGHIVLKSQVGETAFNIYLPIAKVS